MLRNIIKIAFRNLRKQWFYTSINVMGLAVGIAASILVYFIVSYDLSFDTHHKDVNRIYRLVQNEINQGEVSYESGIPYPLRLSFKNEYPEVEALTLVDQNSGNLIKVESENGEVRTFEKDGTQVAFTMPDFFEIFNYEFLLGDPASLKEEGNVIISKRLAELYFGSYEVALGKVINYENAVDLTITGVVANPPKNTDIPHEVFIAFETGASVRIWDSWTATSTSVQAFIKLKENARVEDFQAKIVDYIQKNSEDKDSPTTKELILQPLAEMHHVSEYEILGERVATYKELTILTLIGSLLLIIGCINFINLNTSLAINRSREIGIRKVLGSTRSKIVFQYLSEALMITLAAGILSLGIIEIALFEIENLLGYNLPEFTYNGDFVWFFVSLIVLVTLFSGYYPALIISGFKPINSLRNKVTTATIGGLSLRKSLIVFQLLVAQILIVAVIVVNNQINHILEKPNGFDANSIVQFSIPRPENIDVEIFSERIKAIDGVENFSLSNTGTASSNIWSGTARHTNDREEVITRFQVKIADQNFLETYGIKLLTGTSVKPDSLNQYVLNETAVAELGYEDYSSAIGRDLSIWGQPGTIVGVMKDFKTDPWHFGQSPVAMWYDQNNMYLGSAKVKIKNVDDVMTKVRKEWQSEFPEFTFEYSFLTDSMAEFYNEGKRAKNIFSLFTGIALFIGGIGLLGLVSFLVNQKTKEIGIRKVFGASLYQLLTWISNDFVKLVLVAFAFAAPLSWYLMRKWLEGFATQIELSLWIFAAGLLFSLSITLAIIVSKSLVVSRINPAESLRNE